MAWLSAASLSRGPLVVFWTAPSHGVRSLQTGPRRGVDWVLGMPGWTKTSAFQRHPTLTCASHAKVSGTRPIPQSTRQARGTVLRFAYCVGRGVTYQAHENSIQRSTPMYCNGKPTSPRRFKPYLTIRSPDEVASPTRSGFAPYNRVRGEYEKDATASSTSLFLVYCVAKLCQ